MLFRSRVRETKSETERETQRERQKERQRERQRDRERETERETERDRKRDRERGCAVVGHTGHSPCPGMDFMPATVNMRLLSVLPTCSIETCREPP